MPFKRRLIPSDIFASIRGSEPVLRLQAFGICIGELTYEMLLVPPLAPRPIINCLPLTVRSQAISGNG